MFRMDRLKLNKVIYEWKKLPLIVLFEDNIRVLFYKKVQEELIFLFVWVLFLITIYKIVSIPF